MARAPKIFQLFSKKVLTSQLLWCIIYTEKKESIERYENIEQIPEYAKEAIKIEAEEYIKSHPEEIKKCHNAEEDIEYLIKLGDENGLYWIKKWKYSNK